MDAAEHKHVVLGLVFLKYISDTFEALHAKLERDPEADLEDPDEYRAQNVFWVPPEARWQRLQDAAKQPEVGELVDAAMDAIERENPSLKGVLPREYARPTLDKRRLGALIGLIGTIALGEKDNHGKDVLGRVSEYFLGQFASKEGKKAGEVVRLLVEMIEPFEGRVCSLYLHHALLTPRLRAQVVGYTSGTTVNHLSIEGLRRPPLVVPPAPLVAGFHGLVSRLVELAEQPVEDSCTLAQLRDWLIPKPVSGQVRVPISLDPSP